MKNKALTVSIIIPVYNEERHLVACLDAIAAQSVKPHQVVVVDNNSTDSTAGIAQRYKFVKILKESKQGIVWARNRGFDAATGQIIGRIDADTRLPLDWVERVRDFYGDAKNQNMALTGGCVFYNVRLPRVDQWITSQFVFRMNRLLVGHYVLWGSNMALPKTIWDKVATDVCLRTDIHEDLDLSMHLHRRGYPVHYQADLLVGARMPHTFDENGQIWKYLKMWPRTLQAHNFKLWPLSYVGAGFLWSLQFVPRAAEKIAVLAGRAPLN